MRKLCNVVLCLILVLSLSVTALADDTGLKVHNVTAKKGETVYLAVELTESVIANSMAVSYTYNTKHLKPVPSSCSWAPTGLLQDFDSRGDVGVWLIEEATDLKGGVCVLAFQVRTLARFSETEVTCTLITKGDSQETKTFTATGKVIMDCDHSYGEWTDAGNLGHAQTCSKCDGKHIQSHQWGEGTETPDPNGSGLMKVQYVCQICGGVELRNPDGQKLPVENTEPQNKPSTLKPESTDPTQDDHAHTPQTPSQPQQQQQGSNNQGNTGSDSHDHSAEPSATGATLPQELVDKLMGNTEDHDHDHADTGATLPQELVDKLMGNTEGHDHDHADTGSKSPAGMIICLVISAAIIAGIVLFFKKRKR